MALAVLFSEWIQSFDRLRMSGSRLPLVVSLSNHGAVPFKQFKERALRAHALLLLESLRQLHGLAGNVFFSEIVRFDQRSRGDVVDHERRVEVLADRFDR